MKFFTIMIMLFSMKFCYSQNFIEGSKNTTTYKSGSNTTSTLLLKNKKDKVVAKFVKFNLEIHFENDNSNYLLTGLEETKDWDFLQLADFDFENDGVSEIVVAYGDGYSLLTVLIFKKINDRYIQIGECAGEEKCYLELNKITLPYGSQGLYFEYQLVKNKFKQTVF